MEVIQERLTDLSGRLGRIETMLAALAGRQPVLERPPPTTSGQICDPGVVAVRPADCNPAPPGRGKVVKSYLSVEQVVRRLNGAVSGKLVYKLVAAGKLRANRTTGKLLIEEDSLIELIEGKKRPPTPELPPPPRRPRGRPKKRPEIDLW